MLKLSHILFLPLVTLAHAKEQKNFHLKLEQELIKLPDGTISKLLKQYKSDSHKVRTAIQKLILDNSAEIINSQILSTSLANHGSTESVICFTYPIEYNPPGSDLTPPLGKSEIKLPLDYEWTHKRGHAVKPTPTAFEERYIGSIFKPQIFLNWHPTPLQGHAIVKTEYTFRLVKKTNIIIPHEDKWGKADYTMTQFHSLDNQSSVALKPNKYQLIQALTSFVTPPEKQFYEYAVFQRLIVKPVSN